MSAFDLFVIVYGVLSVSVVLVSFGGLVLLAARGVDDQEQPT